MIAGTGLYSNESLKLQRVRLELEMLFGTSFPVYIAASAGTLNAEVYYLNHVARKTKSCYSLNGDRTLDMFNA